jgi:hypothetical protein
MIPYTERQRKLAILAEHEGYDDIDQLISDAVLGGDSLGICTSQECDNTMSGIEPDETHAICDACYGNTVASVVALAFALSS